MYVFFPASKVVRFPTISYVFLISNVKISLKMVNFPAMTLPICPLFSHHDEENLRKTETKYRKMKKVEEIFLSCPPGDERLATGPAVERLGRQDTT